MGQSRTLAIGDIHGCFNALTALVEAIDLQHDDTVITLGDYVDRGPESRGVIQFLMELTEYCTLVPLLGNHEEMMLSVVVDGRAPQDWLRFGGTATLDSYGFSGDLDVIPSDHIEFLQACQSYCEIDTHFFVHANYDADIPLDQQTRFNLRWKPLTEGLPPPHNSGKIAIVGHTAERSGEILSVRHLKCIDTYCYGGGWLTALDVNSGQVWQANDSGQMRSE